LVTLLDLSGNHQKLEEPFNRAKKDGPPFFTSCTVNNNAVGVPNNPSYPRASEVFPGAALMIVSKGSGQW